MTGEPIESQRHNLLTTVSLAIVACAAADVVHEIVGHGLASWLVGDPVLLISTIALQNAEPNRLVAACGTLANVIVGALSFLSLRRFLRFTPSAYFLWLFGVFNLFNFGYLIASALLLNGDWAVVISGLDPPLIWRVALGGMGVAVYALAMRWAATTMGSFVERGEVALRDLRALTVSAYVTGGLLMTAASAFNPISSSLILISGVGASFGLNLGLLFLPGMIAAHGRTGEPNGRHIQLNPVWLGLALVTAIAFVWILGRGIRLGPAP